LDTAVQREILMREMSEENIELVRRGLEAAFRRPEPDFATLNAVYDPDHEFVSRSEALEGGTRRGARGFRDWMRDLSEAIDWESHVEAVMDIDHDRVLAITPTRIRGKTSGADVQHRAGCIVTVRYGKIIRTEAFSSPEEALRSIGRSE
jgi:ketosteroid isomerase-like protein